MSDNVIAGGPELHLGDIAFMKLNKPYLDGASDANFDVRLKIGMIDKPQRSDNSAVDPLNPNKIINMATGKVCIRWLEYPGGVIRPPEFSTGSGEDYDDFSDREMIPLTHPIMWNDGQNWMGINYMPPVGSVVVVGFRKNNFPVILGFLQQHYAVCEPLKLGEIMISGYGHNSTHWKQNSEIEHKAWISQGEKDGLGATSNSTVGLKLRIKAAASKDDDKSDDPNDPKDRDNKKELIELYAYRLSNGKMIEASSLEVKPESITLNCFVPEENVKESQLKTFNKIQLTKDELNFQSSVKKSSTMSSKSISTSAASDIIKSNVNMRNGNMILSATDSDGENKISVDVNKVELQVMKNGITNSIKMIGNDAFFDIKGNYHFNTDGNFNIKANGKVNIEGASGVKFEGSRIDLN